ncbi:MAG: DUF4910 domain-containing protein [Desulfurococcales archaeon]|nr:DUF4910 domain-containing protein [Desulfurococcales archaeon]
MPGSKGYRDASEYIIDQLRDTGLEVEFINLGDTVYYSRPPGWTVKNAWIKWRDAKWEFNSIATLLAAYSHGTRGNVIEADVTTGKCSGKGVLLTSKNPVVLYKECGDQLNTFDALLYYVDNENRTPSGFPYIRIPVFLSKKLDIPVFTVSRLLAQRIIRKNSKVELFADIDTREHSIPIIRAGVYGKLDEYVVGISHLCHPQPGANDNASGAATLLWIASKLASLEKEGWHPRFGIKLFWVPEYLGTFYALEDRFLDPGKALFAVNLDMVGGDPVINGGSLNLIETSPSRPGLEESVASYFLEKEFSSNKSWAGYSSVPKAPIVNGAVFEFGSDHDALSSYGIPAIMLNQWPDRFYHTNEDSPDKISPFMLEAVGRVTLETVKFISNMKEEDAERYSSMAWRYVFRVLTRIYGGDQGQILPGIRAFQTRLSLVKVEGYSASIKSFMEEQLHRMKILVESLLYLNTKYDADKCFGDESYAPLHKYPPGWIVEKLNVDLADKWYDPKIRTLLVEFYRLANNGFRGTEIEEYLKGYYGLKDSTDLCVVKDFIRELEKMNILRIVR